MRILNLLTGMAIPLMLFVCSPRADAGGLCEQKESTVFACDFTDKKVVAICKGENEGRSYLEYRYGTKKNVEMKFRADQGDAKKMFHFAEVIYASNASDILWFQRDNSFYLVHFPMRGGPVQSIVRGGKTIKRQVCKGGWSKVEGELKDASGLVVNHGSGDVDTMARHWEK